MSENLTVIILAAGKGTRMKSSLHKVLHPIAGKPMVHHLMDQVMKLQPDQIIFVVGAQKEQLIDAMPHDFYPNIKFVEQTEQLGTGHAVQTTLEQINKASGDVLVLYGDVPFIQAATMQAMLAERRNNKSAATVLGFTPNDPAAYGRLVIDPTAGLLKIVEYKDATDEEKVINQCNSGMMAFDADHLPKLLSQMTNDNAAGEYYLTDLVEIAKAQGQTVSVTFAEETEVMGINSRSDLAAAERQFQQIMRQKMMDNGVTLIDPDSVYFSADTVIEPDVTVAPHVFFGPDVMVHSNSYIHPFCHIEGAIIGESNAIGPYARLRPGANLSPEVKIGNFVEVKKSDIGQGSKVNHLSYIGDADVGVKVNVGAGTITCNYDGFKKSKTTLKDGSFIGSNTALVAPVIIGTGAIIGAGSTITKDVEDQSLSIERAPQKHLQGWAVKFRKNAQK